MLAGLALLTPASGEADREPVANAGAPAVISDWSTIAGGPGTSCAFDTPFQFFFHPGSDPTKLLVYFEGGGACWNWVSCSGMFDTSVADDELANFRGIFDFANPDNPFAAYSVLFIPYCTGDVHIGDTVAQYGEAGWNSPAVRHNGYRNVGAALDWAQNNVPQPRALVVAGASAGSYGALFHAPNVAARFPDADLTVIGDSGVPLLNGYPAILDQWGAGRRLRSLWSPDDPAAAGPVTLERAHEVLAGRYPDAWITQITADDDAVQKAFYIFSRSAEWRTATLDLLAVLEARLPNFHAFVIEGSDHGLMRTDRFYEYAADGVRLRDWIDDLVNRRAASSRYCAGCGRD